MDPALHVVRKVALSAVGNAHKYQGKFSFLLCPLLLQPLSHGFYPHTQSCRLDIDWAMQRFKEILPDLLWRAEGELGNATLGDSIKLTEGLGI